ARPADQISLHQREAVGPGPSGRRAGACRRAAARQGRMLGDPGCRTRFDDRAGHHAARRPRDPARRRARRLDRGAARLEAGQGGRFLLFRLGHDPCDRRGDHAGRSAAEQRNHLSPLRLWAPPRAPSRPGHRRLRSRPLH
ncbi:hypothetical protein QU38_01065, partial [Staphylococcus aureus]